MLRMEKCQLHVEVCSLPHPHESWHGSDCFPRSSLPLSAGSGTRRLKPLAPKVLHALSAMAQPPGAAKARCWAMSSSPESAAGPEGAGTGAAGITGGGKGAGAGAASTTGVGATVSWHRGGSALAAAPGPWPWSAPRRRAWRS